MPHTFVPLAAIFALITCFTGCTPESSSPTEANSAHQKPVQQVLAGQITDSSSVQGYRALLQASQARGEVAIALENLSTLAAKAQTIALGHEILRERVPIGSDGIRARLEVLSVDRLRESDLSDPSSPHQVCKSSECFRVDLFDFASSRMLSAVVDIQSNKVLSWRALVGQQPEIPDRLAKLALEIARSSPEVLEALGGSAPETVEVLMANTKTSLNGTRCERSQHLCVAPTFVQGNVAIWAIVDLTDLKLVGVQWTEHGQDGPLSTSTQSVPSEQSLSDAVIMETYCERNTALVKLGWRLDYMLTASDGLQISGVHFDERPVLTSVKLVDWHVSYSEREGFGYADAIGCPSFSSAAVIPFQAPQVIDIKEAGMVVGFRLQQEFRSLGWPGPCNYSYRQSYDFYADGRFRPTAASIGAGCGNDGTYRPLLRIEPAGPGWALQEYSPVQTLADAVGFNDVTHERWFDANGAVDDSGARFTLRQNQAGKALQGFTLVPGRGQFADSRGDFEYVYATAKAAAGEGADELPTLGSCCNTDHKQGPEQFINEPAQPLDQGLVIWYVPQMKNELNPGREYCWANPVLENGVVNPKLYPCEAGPMFVPIMGEAASDAPSSP